MYPLFTELLQKPIATKIESLEHEGETDVDKNVVEQQAAVLSFFADYMEHNPTGLLPHFRDFYEIIMELEPYGEYQAIGKLYCQA